MKLRDLPLEIRASIQRERRGVRAAVDLFVKGVQKGDCQAVVGALEQMELYGCHKAAFRRVAFLERVPKRFRLQFLQLWMSSGDSLRSAVNDDLVLMDSLRVLLPAYSGPLMALYRGESAWNRSRRTYGISWSASLDVADSHARKTLTRTAQGGGVVLKVEAPADAILCAVSEHHEDRYGELEYLVDRRKLPRVDVIRRYRNGDAPGVRLRKS